MPLSILLASFLTVVQLNCENLFDCHHDSLKQDTEFLPSAPRRWTPYRYWRKVDNIARARVSSTSDTTGHRLPDLVALCEVENDSVVRDLARRSLLRTGRYRYFVTDSPDGRGIDVALLYHEFSFAPISHASLRVPTVGGMPPTRDILYVSGRIITDDTLHVFVVHSPSRRDGERATRPYRMTVARRLCAAIDSVRGVSPGARIIVAGDFNDYSGDPALDYICSKSMSDVTASARGANGAKGTYFYKNRWGSLDHILLSHSLLANFVSARVNDARFLLEYDYGYGGVKPRRTYSGYRYSPDGYSDHLPLVVRLRFD